MAAHTGRSTDRDFSISSIFDAPQDFVFRAWTEREHLEKWFGPKGTTIAKCTNDLRPGGVMHYAVRAPDENMMWGRWIYGEIRQPERLVFVASFSNEAGDVTRAPFSAGWPLEMLATVTFEDCRGGTDVTVRSAAHNASELERETFNAAHDSMTQSWSGTFDQLADYLAKS